MKIFLLLACYSLLSSSFTKKPLSFTNSEFTILQVTDMHFGETFIRDQLNVLFLEDFLENVKPDLTVFTGDMLSGEVYEYIPYSNFYEYYWRQWTKPFQEFNLPFALSMGNHDVYANLNRREIMELDVSHPNSYSKVGPAHLSSSSNYFIDIFSSLSPGKVAARVWVFDSGENGCGGFYYGYGCVEKEVVDWYNEESKIFKSQQGIDSVHFAFFHIPLPEFVRLADDFPIAGTKAEIIQCPVFNSGLFDAILDNGNIKGVFCGHDHYNDFQGNLYGVELAYGRKSGYGGYRLNVTFQPKKGGRVIKIREKLRDDGSLSVSFEHYIVNEDMEEELRNPVYYYNGERQYFCSYLDKYYRKYLEKILTWGAIIVFVFVVIITFLIPKNIVKWMYFLEKYQNRKSKPPPASNEAK